MTGIFARLFFIKYEGDKMKKNIILLMLILLSTFSFANSEFSKTIYINGNDAIMLNEKCEETYGKYEFFCRFKTGVQVYNVCNYGFCDSYKNLDCDYFNANVNYIVTSENGYCKYTPYKIKQLPTVTK